MKEVDIKWPEDKGPQAIWDVIKSWDIVESADVLGVLEKVDNLLKEHNLEVVIGNTSDSAYWFKIVRLAEPPDSLCVD